VRIGEILKNNKDSKFIDNYNATQIVYNINIENLNIYLNTYFSNWYNQSLKRK
jgi:hypothetical protein